jgi:DNA-binding NtrC family response regulator
MKMELQTEILLVGETAESSLQLTHWLETRGCKCRFASSCKEACRLISGINFDFVLSHFELPDRTAYPLLEKLIGSATTLFYSTRIENGCLWLPALEKGRKWPGAKALRPNEFAVALGRALEDACSRSSEASPGIPPIETEATRFANLKSAG